MISVSPEFTSWAEKHLELHDSVVGARRPTGEAAASIPRLMPTLKCWDEQCAHFIYGLATPQDRDKHNLVHHTAAHKEQVATTDGPGPLPPVGLRSLRMLDTSLRHLPPVQTSGPAPSSALSIPTSLACSEDKLDVSPSYTLHSGNKSLRRSTDDSDTESMLPPLKKSRFSQPRLESIGELQLFRETEPCLRCHINQTKVSTGAFPLPMRTSCARIHH